MKIRDYFSLNNLDRSLAIIGIFLSLVLIAFLSFFKGRFVYVSVGILILISCILWLLIRRQASGKIYLQSDSTFLLLNIVFFLLLTCNILFIQFRTDTYERPLIYFILLFFMFGIVALEILFYKITKKHQFLILFQIIILSFLLVWSQLLIFPNVVGIDSWGHQRITVIISDTGHIPEGLSYSMLPFMHLDIGSTSLITGLNYKLATMLSISSLQILCGILFVFLLGRSIFNVKVGLLAGLLLAMGNYFISMSFAPSPTTIAAILMLIIIYILFIFRIKNRLIGTSFVILFMISLILTHTVTSMCMSIILFVSYLIVYSFNKVYQKKEEIPVTINIAIFFSVAMFSWWIYASGHIQKLADFIRAGFQEDVFVHAPEAISGYVASTPISEQIFNQLGMFLFFSISFLGCFCMISRKYGNFSTLNIAVVGLTPLAIGFFSLIFGYFIIPERWWYFSQILLAIPTAIAFILLCSKIKNRSIKPIFLFFLTIFISFLMIMSPVANLDNHTFSPNTGIRLALTESEITTAAFFVEKSADTTISSDDDYFTSQSSSILLNYYNVNHSKIIPLENSLLTRKFDDAGSIIVIREEIVNKPFRLSGQPFKLNYDPKQVLEEQDYSRIYDCTSVSGFYINK